MSKRKTINNRFCEAKSAEYEKTEQVYLAKVCDIRTDGIEKNLQGDVVAVYNDLGQLLISYKYTAYGEFWMSASNNGFNTKAASNPFTYRGYYFDSDLNLYYLGSRYYDYNTCRFINADKVMSGANGSLEGYNLYVYCFNNPIMFTDESGNWPKFLKKAVNKVVNAVKEVAYSVYYNATAWHFEEREEKNGEPLSYDEISDPNSEWTKLSENQSVYHDNGVGAPEEKYTHPDGREWVFDGDTKTLVVDPKYMGTYNYCPVHQSKGDKNVSDYLKIAGTSVGHFFADMLPYYITGNSNTREQFESKIGIFN